MKYELKDVLLEYLKDLKFRANQVIVNEVPQNIVPGSLSPEVQDTSANLQVETLVAKPLLIIASLLNQLKDLNGISLHPSIINHGVCGGGKYSVDIWVSRDGWSLFGAAGNLTPHSIKKGMPSPEAMILSVEEAPMLSNHPELFDWGAYSMMSLGDLRYVIIPDACIGSDTYQSIKLSIDPIRYMEAVNG